MKRTTTISLAVLFTMLLVVNFASAQKRGGSAEVKQSGPPRQVEVTEKPGEVANPSKVTGTLKETPVSFDSSTHTLWDSGELQKEIGSKNKDKKKIVMRVWCEYKRVSPVNYSWQILYSLKAENKNLIGSGWHEVSDLYGITYDVAYTLGSNPPKAENGFKSHSGGTAMGQIASGTSTLALPNFTTNRFTGKRGGGSSGIDLDWP